MVYGWWHFQQEVVSDLVFEIEIPAGDERVPGRYFQLYQGKIAGIGFYLGLQTDLAKPGCGGMGKGLLFSRWNTRNDADARVALGGWIENAGHEGDFIGVRIGYGWQAGTRYECILRPEDDPMGRWYEFVIKPKAGGQEVSCGALHYPWDKVRGRPSIYSGGGSWLEAYRIGGGVIKPEEVPETYCIIHSLTANSGGICPIRCDVNYSDTFPPADAFVDSSKALHLRAGRGVVRQHPAQSYTLTK